jgi:hypothetical protein
MTRELDEYLLGPRLRFSSERFKYSVVCFTVNLQILPQRGTDPKNWSINNSLAAEDPHALLLHRFADMELAEVRPVEAKQNQPCPWSDCPAPWPTYTFSSWHVYAMYCVPAKYMLCLIDGRR